MASMVGRGGVEDREPFKEVQVLRDLKNIQQVIYQTSLGPKCSLLIELRSFSHGLNVLIIDTIAYASFKCTS